PYTIPGHVYMYQHNGVEWEFDQLLEPDDLVVGDHYGIDVAAADNGAVLVGAVLKSNPGEFAGKAYSFFLDDLGTSDTLMTEMEFDDLARFGFAIDIDGDTALVGAPFENNGASESGGAYVFTHNGTD